MLFRGTRFCRNYSLALIATFGVLIGLEQLPGLNPGYSALLVLPLLAVAVVEGKIFARTSRARPGNCAACFACLQMALLSAVILQLAWAAGQAWMPGPLAALGPLPFDSMTATALVFLITAMLTLRLGYHLGVRSELQSQTLAAASPRDYTL